LVLDSTIILLLILAAAIFGKANSVAIATCMLLMLKLLRMDKYVYPTIEKNGMTFGLILLIAAIMIPIANGKITFVNIKSVFASWIGLTALILSFLTTYLSGQGLNYLTVQGHSDIMPAMIVGAVAAAAFLGGVPVGPLITSGMLAVFAKIIHK
jgi:uncharacterized membrane protein (DUF441 family)